MKGKQVESIGQFLSGVKALEDHARDVPVVQVMEICRY